MLPPSQMQLSVNLTEDNVLVYRTATAEDARVIISKFVLWFPRLLFNPNVNNNFRISPSILNPKYVFVFFQRSAKMDSQVDNPYLFDTFKLNAADNNCYLQSARLSVGNGIYYPEIEYSYDNIARIFKTVNNYAYKQNDKNTGSLLNIKNFKSLYGMLFFNISYKNEPNNITNDPKEIILNYKLNTVPTADYTIYSIVLYEQTVKLDVIGSELIIYT